MPNFSCLQIPPPSNWQDFEILCCDLWREIWKYPNTQKNGRQGQAQHGVDVYGIYDQNKNTWAGVQCKGKDNYTDKQLTENEVKNEVQKAKCFKPELSEYIIATTGPRDAKIQELARIITESHRSKKLFSVHIWAWPDIVEIVESFPGVLAKHYPILGTSIVSKEFKVPDEIQTLFDKGLNLRNLGKYENARTVFQKSLELATSYKDNLAIIRVKYYLSIILIEWDKNHDAAKTLLKEALQEFRNVDSDNDISAVLFQLGVVEMNVGNLDQAKAYFSQSLELDKRNKRKFSVAQTLHQLGWLEDHRGHSKEALELYNQALTRFLSIYQEDNCKDKKDVINSIAGCYHHIGLVYDRKGQVDNTESNYMRALEWHRKSDFKPDEGKTLYLLARFKYREGHYDVGTQFLDEAIQIYNKIRDYDWYAKCIDLKGKLHFTIGQKEKAVTIFKSALNTVEKSVNDKDKEVYLNKLGNLHLEIQELEQAKEYFDRAKSLSFENGFLDGYAHSVKGLAEIANIKKNHNERDKLLSEGINTLEKLLPSIQAEPKRAFIIGEIGFFYEKKEDFQQALSYYQRGKKLFEDLSDIGGIGNCLGSIARMKGLLGKKNEEFDTYRELKKVVDGTPYYNLIAGTAINLGEIHMQIGNLNEAKIMFKEADFLCQKYNLHYSTHIAEAIKRLADLMNLRKPPELNLKQLIQELFELIEWFPEAKDSILRLWMSGRIKTLYSYCRNNRDINFMVCQDDLDIFLRISRKLHHYSDLCLQVVSCEYPGTGIDIIPFPKNKKIFFDCAVPYKEKINEGFCTIGFLSGGIHSRYTITSDTAHSKITGNEGVTIVGWSLGLPDQAHKLILSSSADELLNKKVFFLPYERCLANDTLLSDLDISKETRMIPVYFRSLPHSNNINVVISKEINLPIISPGDIGKPGLRKNIRKIKQTLLKLSSTTGDSVFSSFDDFIFEIENLNNDYICKQSMQIQIYLLDFLNALKRELRIAMVIDC